MGIDSDVTVAVRAIFFTTVQIFVFLHLFLNDCFLLVVQCLAFFAQFCSFLHLFCVQIIQAQICVSDILKAFSVSEFDLC